MIGERCKHIAPEDADDYIAGYTVANDYGLHDFRDTDAGSMLRVKGSDTLCPLGPGLVTDWDFHGKRIQTPRERRGRAGRDHRRDGLGHALPRRRHRAHDHAPAERRDPVGHARELPPGGARRRRRGRGRGARNPPELHRRGRRARPRGRGRPAERVRRGRSPRPSAATGSSGASARRSAADRRLPGASSSHRIRSRSHTRKGREGGQRWT